MSSNSRAENCIGIMLWMALSFLTVPSTQGYVPSNTFHPYNTIKFISLIPINNYKSRPERLYATGMNNNQGDDDDDVLEPNEDDDDDGGGRVIPLSRIDAIQKMLLSTTTDDNNNNNNNNNDTISSIQESNNRRNLVINVIAGSLLVSSGIASTQLYTTNVYTPTGFRRLPSIQFIAALGDPKSSSGQFNPASSDLSAWGLWKMDPGPRGVYLRDYDKIFVPQQANPPITAPAGWIFDNNDWWLEEHGIIMEQPIFPIKPGRYLVTGGRSITTGLTIDSNGYWKLDDGVTLYDVTHLPCRSARYRPIQQQQHQQQNNIVEAVSPKQANLNDFPVRPGATMPNVPGYTKQDYAVLFLVGVATAA